MLHSIWTTKGFTFIKKDANNLIGTFDLLNRKPIREVDENFIYLEDEAKYETVEFFLRTQKTISNRGKYYPTNKPFNRFATIKLPYSIIAIEPFYRDVDKIIRHLSGYKQVFAMFDPSNVVMFDGYWISVKKAKVPIAEEEITNIARKISVRKSNEITRAVKYNIEWIMNKHGIKP